MTSEARSFPDWTMSSLSTAGGNKVYLRTLIDDEKVVEHVLCLTKNEDDPPIVFGWNDAGLKEFWGKAAAYGATRGALLPPNSIHGGVAIPAHDGMAAVGQDLDNLKIGIINFVRLQENPPPAVFGVTAGLACSQQQFGLMIARLAQMIHHPWFAAVVGHGAPLKQPLASIWLPRARVASGQCDQIHIRDALIQ